MPIYEYRCASCGHENEYLQKVSDPLLTECPLCGKPTFEKQVSAAGFQLKGSGWYVTDFRDSGKKPASGKSSAEKDKPAADTSAADSKAPSTTDQPTEKKKEEKAQA